MVDDLFKNTWHIRIVEELAKLGATEIKVEGDYTENNPNDPEGWSLPPTIHPLIVTASGVTQGQIDSVVLSIAEEKELSDLQDREAEAEAILHKILNNPDLLAALKAALLTEE